MYRCLRILDVEWVYQALTRLSATTIYPVAHWPHDANEGRWNQNTRGVLYVSYKYDASQQSSCLQHHINNSH